jgi:hypothetical protein
MDYPFWRRCAGQCIEQLQYIAFAPDRDFDSLSGIDDLSIIRRRCADHSSAM